MLESKLIALIVTYQYPLLIPLAIIEGHFLSLIVGFIARTTGLINPVLAALCIIIGNLIGDMILYWIGYHHGTRFGKRHGDKLRDRFGINDESLAKGRDLFHKHKSSILIVSKVTNGLGLAMAILITAGMMRIRFATYMFWNVIGETIWTTGLVCIGYFLGEAYRGADSIIGKVATVVGILALLALAFLYIKNRIKKQMKL
mgnify:CR=1 FL=1